MIVQHDMTPFEGLNESLPACLRELQRNDSRASFHAHREEFERRVVAPLAALAPGGGLAAILAADYAALGAMYHLFCAANERRIPGQATGAAHAKWITRHP